MTFIYIIEEKSISYYNSQENQLQTLW